MKNKNILLIAICILIASLNRGISQTNIAFTAVNAEPDGSIQLHWTSNTNGEYYEIDYANALATNADGSTAWTDLYDDYPSQGTNTLWQDAGNPRISVPFPSQSPTRFYRITVAGTNTTGDGLSVAITNLSNGDVVSGNVIVSVMASSSNMLSSPILYLDGREMPPSYDGTNFLINTCNSWNGTHTLYAVDKSQSALEGNNYTFGITYDRAVSPMVNVTFENLITLYSFSQPIFQPSLGQTQMVSASFTANCNWTLQILDVNNNPVRTVTGSGNSMSFGWDGTGDGETNIADGLYSYVLNAATNGLANELTPSGTNSGSSNPPTPDAIMFAAQPDSESVVPAAIIPPGMNTNGMTFFSATPAQVNYLRTGSLTASRVSPMLTSGSGGQYFTPNDSGGSGSGQSSTNNGAKNQLGTVGVCYQQFLNTNISTTAPVTGFPYGGGEPYYVGLDGAAASEYGSVKFGAVPQTKSIADGFTQGMIAGAYYGSGSFEYGDDQVKFNDLKKTSLGGNSILNNVNFGFLISHGSYGTTAEDDGVKYTYVWIENLAANSVKYLHLSDFDFGGSDPTNGLRWMTVFTCDTLYPANYNSMNSHSKLPVNNNLHLLLSDSTVIWFAPIIGSYYAQNLTQNQDFIVDAWNGAGSDGYAKQHLGITNSVVFNYVGWPACAADTLYLYESPDTGDGLQNHQTTVFTYPYSP